MRHHVRERRAIKLWPSFAFAAWCLVLAASFFSCGHAGAAQITLAWDAADGVAGYNIYYGTASDAYTTVVDAGNVTTYSLNLPDGYTYYLAATAYDSDNLESDFSDEISYNAGSSACSYTLSATSASISASGGSGSVKVTTQTGCSWSASAGASWVTITSGASGTGSGTVSYTVAANTGSSRTAASTIAGKTYTISQSGLASYTITASAGTGGSISPSGSVAVTSGASKTFTITPSSGYSVSSVTVDGTSVGAITTYTFSNVTANHTIAATFKTNGYTITASAGTGGSISPSGSVAVTSGASKTFTITPSSGYSVSSVTVDGTSVGAVTTYTFSNVTANHTIAATFTAPNYTLTVTRTGTGSGSVTSNPGGTSFPSGTLVTLTALPSTGSTFAGWSGACSGTGETCQVTMNANKSVGAAFATGIPKISVSVASINFGTVKNKVSMSKTVTIKNMGTGSLTVGTPSLTGTNAGEFSASANCSALLKNQTCTVTVNLTATSFGSKTAALAISSNDSAKPTSTVSLRGTCAPPKISLSAAAVNFGTVKIGSVSASRKITIRNTGTSDLAITTVSRSGSRSFIFTDNQCGGSIAKGGSCTITMAFRPSRAGSMEGSLNVYSNDPAKGTATVSLSGTAQ